MNKYKKIVVIGGLATPGVLLAQETVADTMDTAVTTLQALGIAAVSALAVVVIARSAVKWFRRGGG